jgi:ERCC4-related helicase
VTGQTPFPPGARIVVREAEWLVRSCTATERDGYKIRATGISELVRDTDAVFFTELEDPRPVLLRPEETVLVPDDSAEFAKGRLFLEATLRRTPLQQSERGIALADRFLLDPLTYQQRPAELALRNLRPRILIADVVGLGKTLEIGLILAELIRRGRGERILVVTPQQILEQFQQELWNRFAIPLIRLDSLGIQRIQQEIPAGRNPFTHYKRIIISIDTLKGDAYRQHLENMDWDAVVIDESHNLMGSGNFRNKLAKRLAPHTHALLLASATPHNGNAESLAELVNMLDPAAIADKHRYEPKDVEHLYIRRTKISPEVSNEIGGKWAGRGPSVPVRCPATLGEERVFEELTATWLTGSGGSKDRRLSQYSLLKAFLSSHQALTKTIGNRLKNTADAGERAALTRLAELAAQIGDDDSAKLSALVARLKDIGVGPGSDTRAVVFSESVPTLQWLHRTLPGRLGLTRQHEVDIMHGGFSDTEQQEIVKRFSLVDDPVRVLVTGDVASEGVNMHTLCHHLIHYDLPWSLIRIEQRNGRIDRYGQVHEPQFAALILTSQTEGAKDDTTVAEKLLAKEAEAHRSLGTAEAVTRLYSARKEEDRLVQDLLAGKSVDESLQAAGNDDDDFLAGLLNGVGDRPANPEPLRAKVPKLFKDTETFAREALSFACPDLHIDDDGEMLAFAPPEDLISRLKALPSSYLKRHNVAERMKVTFSRPLAQRKLDEARDTKNLWPDIGYLSDLHPMIEWLTDKVLLRVVRQQAPVLIANVSQPVFLIQGVYSNALGQPTVVEWMAVTGLPDDPRISEMTKALTQAGVGPGMVNTLQFGDIGVLQELIPDAVKVARAHLEDERAAYDALVDEPINAYRERVLTWEQASLIDVPVPVRTKREKSVRATATELNDMITKLHTAGEPLLRVLAVLDGGR